MPALRGAAGPGREGRRGKERRMHRRARGEMVEGDRQRGRLSRAQGGGAGGLGERRGWGLEG